MTVYPDASALRGTAEAAARAGAAALEPFRSARRELGVREKADRDFVTAADVAAERAIRAVIQDRCPGHEILGEEEEGARLDTATPLWVIDPLDGTANFIHGYPVFSVSVACATGGEPVAAAVLDVTRDDLYAAARGGGATKNGRSIRVSGREREKDALVATGFPFRRMHRAELFLRSIEEVLKRTSGVRRAGSAALDLAWVASGALDGFWEEGLGPWDIAAGALLVEEAGGIVTDFAGGRRHLATGTVVAATPALHVPLRDLIFSIQGEGS